MSARRENFKSFWDHRFNRHSVMIMPGDFYVSDNDEETIVTLLGSCVAACIRDKESGIGGLNHFMLPTNGKSTKLSSENVKSWMFEYENKSARYGSVAMELLINEIMKRGGKRHNLEAKIFGGGQIGDGTALTVGQNNVTFVKEYLAIEEIPIVAEDTCNKWPLKVYFMPDTGEVFVKRVQSDENKEIANLEKQYSTELAQRDIQGGIFYLD